MTRIKDILKERKITLKEFAVMLDITYTALYYQLDKPSYPTLQKWAAALGVPIWQLFVSPEEVATPTEATNDFCAFIRYNGIHYTADTIDEFNKIAEELKTITK